MLFVECFVSFPGKGIILGQRCREEEPYCYLVQVKNNDSEIYHEDLIINMIFSYVYY